jgi:molybdate transport repressor ModE-like protein
MEKDPFSDFKVSVELDGEKRISGNNLFDLLEKIDRFGSISRAASEMGISYRYSWGLIQAAEKALGLALVNKQIGGHEGGGTSLTLEGKELLGQYKEFKGEVDTQLSRFVKKQSRPPIQRMAKGTVLPARFFNGTFSWPAPWSRWKQDYWMFWKGLFISPLLCWSGTLPLEAGALWKLPKVDEWIWPLPMPRNLKMNL